LPAASTCWPTSSLPRVAEAEAEGKQRALGECKVFAVKEDDVPDPNLPDDAQMTVIPVTMIFFMVDGGDGCTQGE